MSLLTLAPTAALAAAGATDVPVIARVRPASERPDSMRVLVVDDPTAEGFEELILDIRAGQEVSRAEFAFARHGHSWVPASAVLELLELHAVVDSLGVLRARLEPEGTALTLDPRTGKAWRGDTYRLAHDEGLFVHGGALYVRSEHLAWMLDVAFYEDFVDMAVIFDGIDELPLGRRLYRERMHRIQEAFDAEPDVVYAPERPAWSGATLDWNVGVPSFQMLDKTSVGLGFGGALVGGAMDLRYRGRVDGRGPEDLDARWQGVWPDQAWLRQLELGATRATGPRGRIIDGVSLGNSPFLRSSEFGETVLRGQLEPGWEVEVYRSGRLIAWDRVDERGFWEFAVPLDYGQNPVEVRAYGPNGEVQISERVVRVDFDRIPAGTFEYGLSAGGTELRNTEFTTNADLRYGLNNAWTVRGGYDGFRLGDGSQAHHPYLAVTGSVTGPLRIGGERVVDAWWWTGASLEPSSDLRLGLQRYRYDRRGASGVFVTRDDQARTALDFFWRPSRERRNLFFDLDVERIEARSGRRTKLVAGATNMLGRVRTSLQLKESFDRHDGGTYRQSALALQASTILRSDDRHWWHGVQLRFQTELDIRGGRDDWYRLSLGRNVGPSARLEVGTGWSRLDGTAQFTIGISSTGRHAYVNAWMTGQREPGVTTQLAAEGSLLYQADQGRVETYPFRSLGRGGLSGTVFVDTNGNGVLDRGEETVPGARLQADYMLTETDANGHYAIWNLTPFEAANIQVDPESLRNPLWVPTFDLAQVAVTPNGFRRVDLPLVESLEIEGRIRTRAGDALHAPGAVPLKLVQLDGDREYRTRSFSDGEFYLLGVVPGTYRCEIDARWLESRGLSVDPVSDLRLVARSGAGVVTFELVLETTP